MTHQSVGKGLLRGFKMALGFLVVLPFIGLLLPLWYLYRWNECRSGRPMPVAPWAEVWPRADRASAPACVADRWQHPATETVLPHHGLPSSDLPSALAKPNAGGVAVVTGGARHLGAAICQDLATLGYRVAVLYHHSAPQAKALVADIQERGGIAHPFPLDQRDPAQCIQMLDAVQQRWGVPELLINNASLFVPTPLEESSWEGLEQLWRVNLQGPLWLALRAGERMRNRQDGVTPAGQIIQMCDIWGERPLAGYGGYSISKAGLIMATRVLARELAPQVRVNGIAPGAILAKSGESRFQTLLARTPLASAASPEAVLHGIRYLLTARFVTGEILHVDGGRSLV
ncbi:MAG: SDR family oxidoreductase [Magnetococcales bacterium]|nr:SDR family oxidoreductase [Magnetococcales bacterium]